MRQSLPYPKDETVRTSKKDDSARPSSKAKDSDSLLSDTRALSTSSVGSRTEARNRSRKTSKSPPTYSNQHFQPEATPLNRSQKSMYQATDVEAPNQELGEVSSDYTEIGFHANRSQNAGYDEASQNSHLISHGSSVSSRQPRNRQSVIQSNDIPSQNQSTGASDQHPPLIQIPEEVYAVRKSALQVLKPLTRTWVVVTVGFALTVLFAMARWTRLLRVPFWFILLPSWCSHVGLLWCHVLSARALSGFIAEANENRQRPDSRDHLNRTEYLPLLQRSLKFGLKTGLLSFSIFLFETLIYIRLAWGRITLAAVFTPLWIIVVFGILDGIICKNQHVLRVLCWLLMFLSMLLTVLKVDDNINAIRWRFIFIPVVVLLSVLSGSLIYIVYGHQIGFYQLSESQLTAGNLYSLAALICIVLFVVIGEVIPLSRPVEIETRIFMVIMAPLVVCLVGMGAWVVSRDEFGRLLLYGGQAAVHPMKLRWESNGWTSVQSKGVTTIPMFGEVSFRPLKRDKSGDVCMPCLSCYTWYQYENENDEETGVEDLGNHPYLSSSPTPILQIHDLLRIR